MVCKYSSTLLFAVTVTLFSECNAAGLWGLSFSEDHLSGREEVLRNLRSLRDGHLIVAVSDPKEFCGRATFCDTSDYKYVATLAKMVLDERRTEMTENSSKERFDKQHTVNIIVATISFFSLLTSIGAIVISLYKRK